MGSRCCDEPCAEGNAGKDTRDCGKKYPKVTLSRQQHGSSSGDYRSKRRCRRTRTQMSIDVKTRHDAKVRKERPERLEGYTSDSSCTSTTLSSSSSTTGSSCLSRSRSNSPSSSTSDSNRSKPSSIEERFPGRLDKKVSSRGKSDTDARKYCDVRTRDPVSRTKSNWNSRSRNMPFMDRHERRNSQSGERNNKNYSKSSNRSHKSSYDSRVQGNPSSYNSSRSLTSKSPKSRRGYSRSGSHRNSLSSRTRRKSNSSKRSNCSNETSLSKGQSNSTKRKCGFVTGRGLKSNSDTYAVGKKRVFSLKPIVPEKRGGQCSSSWSESHSHSTISCPSDGKHEKNFISPLRIGEGKQVSLVGGSELVGEKGKHYEDYTMKMGGPCESTNMEPFDQTPPIQITIVNELATNDKSLRKASPKTKVGSNQKRCWKTRRMGNGKSSSNSNNHVSKSWLLNLCEKVLDEVNRKRGKVDDEEESSDDECTVEYVISDDSETSSLDEAANYRYDNIGEAVSVKHFVMTNGGATLEQPGISSTTNFPSYECLSPELFPRPQVLHFSNTTSNYSSSGVHSNLDSSANENLMLNEYLQILSIVEENLEGRGPIETLQQICWKLKWDVHYTYEGTGKLCQCQVIAGGKTYGPFSYNDEIAVQREAALNCIQKIRTNFRDRCCGIVNGED